MAGVVIILEADLVGVDPIPLGPVAHVGPAPAHKTGLGEDAVDGVAGGGPGKEVDPEAFSLFRPSHQGLRDQFGIPGRKTRNKHICPVLNVNTRRIRIGNLVHERLEANPIPQHDILPQY
jgi:hypothetical protein